MRSTFMLPILAVAALGAPGERELLARWPDAEPGERVELRRELERVGRARRIVEARCVLVRINDRTYTLAELFAEILEPALVTSTKPTGDDAVGFQPVHLAAQTALQKLRAVHRAPAPVGTATLNLLLGYASETLDAWRLPPRARLRLFMEVLRNVRTVSERVQPDARTRWIVHDGILPTLLGMARRFEDDAAIRDSISEAAALLSLPSVLDDGAQAQLASLARGSHARDILLNAYRRGRLDDLGVTALARSVVLQAKDDDAFLSGAAPLLLELLGDRHVPASVRGEIVDLVLARMAPVPPLAATAAELLAAAFGGPPRTVAEFAALRKARRGPVPRPEGGEPVRFLQVVLLRARADVAPAPVRVVRIDVRLHDPIHAAGRAFVGMLVPSKGGDHADFLGPSPGTRGVPDNRLLRRTLALERIAMRAYGSRGEELELCVALPRDGSEPVPIAGARLQHVLDLIRGRLERTQDATEIADLSELLVRIGTPEARELARKADDAGALLDLLEKGDASAAQPLLAKVAALDPAQRERAFAALLALRKEAMTRTVRDLARKAAIDIAVPAGDALLKAGDASGVRALLRHDDRYARLAGAGLALRLTPVAGGLRIIPERELPVDALAELAAKAFPAEWGGSWKELGRWLPNAIREPGSVRSARGKYALLFDGKGRPRIRPAQFAVKWTGIANDGKFKSYWPWVIPFVLSPKNPGRELTPKALDVLLDAFEKRLGDEALRRVWVDSFVTLAVVQSGIEFDTEFAALAETRLRRLAGKKTPVGARRKPGLYWPIWASKEAR